MSSNLNDPYNKLYSQYIDEELHVDHFFTQRTIDEYEEFMDPKDIKLKNRKVKAKYNFVAICLPNIPKLMNSNNNISTEIKIWGDKKFKYEGSIKTIDGGSPSVLLKLDEDTRLFINIKIIDNKENNLVNEYITFVDIPKKYRKDGE